MIGRKNKIKGFAALLVLLFATAGSVRAQEPAELYYPYAYLGEERLPELRIDTLLFYGAVQSPADLYGEATAYTFWPVAERRRGLPDGPLSLGGTELSWTHAALLRRLNFDEAYVAGLSMAGEPGGLNGGLRFAAPDEAPAAGRAAALSLTDRDYRMGLRLSLTERLGERWTLSAVAEGRTGRDARIDGVFSNRLNSGVSLVRRDGEELFDVTLLVPWSQRGLRSASTREAYDLLGDRYYNPSWGFQAGKARNSHVRRELLPLLTAGWRRPLGRGMTLALRVAAETGVRRYSALSWFDATTPMPDNYRYLPGYFTGDDRTAVEAVWRAADARYTQIDWARLYRSNRLAGGEARYALEDRVERPLNLQLAARLSTSPDERLEVDYALHLAHRSTRHYKTLRDLLGADRLTDIDYYLVDDDTYSNRLQNDLRHPDRRIGEGDRFGYDYRLVRQELRASVTARYRTGRTLLSAAVEAGMARIVRRGFYEKELFSGAGSYGRSRPVRLAPFLLKAGVGHTLSPRNHLEVTLAVAGELPDEASLFLQPQYNNRPAGTSELRRRYAAEAVFNHTGGGVDLRLTLFATLTEYDSYVTRFYDDLSSLFADMTVRGIGRLGWGGELAVRWEPAWHWSVDAALSAGRYTYSRNPEVTLYADNDNRLLVERSASYVSGLRQGGVPAVLATVEAGYFGEKGWIARFGVRYAGGRYVDPSYLYRTSRVANQAAESPEAFALFTAQERLGDAFTADLSVGRSLRLARSRLTVLVQVHNLFNDRKIVYSAYESNRIRRISNGERTLYRPFDRRYLYAYPRSLYLTVSYKF